MKENDALVWSGLFRALATDASAPSAALAYAGLSHPSPEVRRLACEHLGRQPEPRHAAMLLAALNDPHVSVQIEAINALGHPNLLQDAKVLDRPLASRDVNLRIAAARTLQKNRLPQGAAALERLANDVDAETRRRAAVVMGDTGDAEFIPTLIKLTADDMLGVRKAAVENLVKLVGRDVSVQPGETLPSLAERAAAWRTWYERGR
jgi:HEAT repeat protein